MPRAVAVRLSATFEGDTFMKKYTFARFLCWLVVVAGLGTAVLALLTTVLGFALPIGLTMAPFSLGMAVGGVLIALLGFVCLAFFDLVQHLTQTSPRV